MTKLYISEYSGLATTDYDPQGILPQPPVATQVVDYTAGVANSNPFNTLTRFVELHNDSIASVAVGNAVVATTNSPRYAAGERVIYGVKPGDRASAITNT